MKRIVLVGFAASYKSSAGRLLADRMQLSFYDTDDIIEANASKTINEIVERYGESELRKLEKDAIMHLPKNDIVVSTGGGALLDEQNCRILSDGGVVVWLKTSLDAIMLRLDGDFTRPLHNGKDIEQLRQMLAMRETNYARYANVIIDTDNKNPQQVAGEIYAHICMCAFDK